MSLETERLTDPYIMQLGINWPVRSGFGPVDRPSIVSSKKRRVHEITFPVSYGGRLAELEFDVVHEMVHAKFAESLDQIFSAVYFHPSYDTDDPGFRQRAGMVYYSQALVDVWVSDRMARIDPKLIEKDVASWFGAVDSLPPAVLRQSRLETILGYAIGHAQIVRQKIKGYEKREAKALGKIRLSLGGKEADLAQRLAGFYTGLPS